MGAGDHGRSPEKAYLFIIFLVSGAVFAPPPVAAAARPLLHGDWWSQDWGLLLGSLPKGSVAPSGPSGCTHGSYNIGGSCPIPRS
ncbi:hypothetical protein AXF42_Ash010705 [Apostasia shenzhenica]|uniref:Uncharacterized protein n=1 Tax=Apostasia shenzhenica TaxID=1088818 RepID=A0A2I0A6W9_9ASPA|nr:hypothetical protein AXF42_Ash010705 [Apostasia shenzhenica]